MSRIDDLIAQHCPDGVTFKSLGNCLTVNKGGGTPSRAKPEYWNGSIPWASVGDLTATKTVIRSTRQKITNLGLESCSSNVIPAGYLIAAVKIAPGAVRVVEADIAINQDLRGLKLVDELVPHFVAYYFETLNITGNGSIVRGITNATLEAIPIPVPPLEVQREIVRILDTFTELEAALEAELAARRQQYEYYRETLLAPSGDWSENPLGSLLQIKNGKDHKALGDGNVPVYGSGGIMRNVDRAAASGPTVLIPRKGSLGNIFYVEGPFWVVDTIFRTEINQSLISPKFLFHKLHTMKLGDLNQAGGVPSQTQSVLKKLTIRHPSLNVQNDIVKKLDALDTLVNDISVGLPAELEARRQQYEYYRDKLLTFKEASA